MSYINCFSDSIKDIKRDIKLVEARLGYKSALRYPDSLLQLAESLRILAEIPTPPLQEKIPALNLM